jgi:hypothetical protein
MYVPETKSKRDKHNFKYFKRGAILILATGAILYRYAYAVPSNRSSSVDVVTLEITIRNYYAFATDS